MTINKKNSIEKFMETLDEDEKSLLSKYITTKTAESLSEKFDEILKKSHETKKTDS